MYYKSGKSKCGKFITVPPGLEVPEYVGKLIEMLPPRHSSIQMPDYSETEDVPCRWLVTPLSIGYITADEINDAYKGVFSENFIQRCKEFTDNTINYKQHKKISDKLISIPIETEANMNTEDLTPPAQQKLNTEIAAENAVKDGIHYTSIEDYTEKTGKRFRMTKELKNLGLTRQQAFEIIFGGKSLADIQKNK